MEAGTEPVGLDRSKIGVGASAETRRTRGYAEIRVVRRRGRLGRPGGSNTAAVLGPRTPAARVAPEPDGRCEAPVNPGRANSPVS